MRKPRLMMAKHKEKHDEDFHQEHPVHGPTKIYPEETMALRADELWSVPQLIANDRMRLCRTSHHPQGLKGNDGKNT
jgi:hypothetical protein